MSSILRGMDLLAPHTVAVASTGAAREGGLASSWPVALAVELAPEGAAPEWIPLLPAGSTIAGVDGRTFRNPDPSALVAEFNRIGLPIPLDFDHATEIAAPEGRPAPAAGWIEELQVRSDGMLWGRVNWTARGAETVKAREYRFISPAFLFEKASGRIVRLRSAALTNTPNFVMSALNREETTTMDKEQRKALCATLGLAETATDAEIVAAAQKVKAEHATATARAATPPLDKFVPRGDYDAALAKATAAETKLAERDKADLTKAIETEISAALTVKKISPATADYHRAMCAQPGGLDQFKAYIKAAPVLAPDQVITGDPAKAGAAALSADQLAICRTMGIAPEEFARARAV